MPRALGAVLALAVALPVVAKGDAVVTCRVSPGQEVTISPSAWLGEKASGPWSTTRIPDWLAWDERGGKLVGRAPEGGDEVATLERRDRDGRSERLDVRIGISSRAPLALPESVRLQARPFESLTISLPALLEEPGCGLYTWGLSPGAPGWLTLVGSTLRGTPRVDHAGSHTFHLFVISQGMGAMTEVTLDVTAATFLPDQLDAGLLKVGRAVSFPVPRWIQHPQGTPLQYRWVQKPAWLIVRPDGSASGTPLVQDLGDFAAVIETSMAIGVVGRTTVVGRVVENLPPRWKQSPLSLPVACLESDVYRFSLNGVAVDPDGDKLAFAIPLPPFEELKITEDGFLEFRPLGKHGGKHQIYLEATDGEYRVGVSGLLAVTECRR